MLAHYFTGTTLGSIEPGRIIRVRLTEAFIPTETLPAKVIARGGSWQSPLFPEMVFPADSYLDMRPIPDVLPWQVDVFDAAGALLATGESADLMMERWGEGTLFEMKFRDSLRKYDLYRGDMRMRITSAGALQAINIVGLEDYLKGVVPAEVVYSWPVESLRAQAVASRGLALDYMKSNKAYHDVVPTAANQVYGGVRIEYNRTSRAVLDTADVVVLTSTGKIAKTLFFDTAGGHTEHDENAWPDSTGMVSASPTSYLRGVPDVDPDGVPYDITSPRYAWSAGPFTMSQLSTILLNDSRVTVGEVQSIEFVRGVSGRIIRATLTGPEGTVHVSGTVFKNIYNKHRLSVAELRSRLFYLEDYPGP
jgi:SpoIID/LytB domain protein